MDVAKYVVAAGAGWPCEILHSSSIFRLEDKSYDVKCRTHLDFWRYVHYLCVSVIFYNFGDTSNIKIIHIFKNKNYIIMKIK